MGHGLQKQKFEQTALFNHELLLIAVRYLDDELKQRFPDTAPHIPAVERLGVLNLLQQQDSLQKLQICARRYSLRFPSETELHNHAVLSFKAKIHAAE